MFISRFFLTLLLVAASLAGTPAGFGQTLATDVPPVAGSGETVHHSGIASADHPFAVVPIGGLVASTPVEQYIQDEAELIREPVRSQILAVSREMEESLKIRILIRTEFIDDMAGYSNRVEGFFSEWIRSIGLEKRGILLFAGLPRNSIRGKFNLRVGIGLKYLITREMGERVVNRVILPANAENNDGRGFLEGVLTIKRMLLDEYRSEKAREVTPTGSFDFGSFIWRSKEVILILFGALFLGYMVLFIERCPRCNGNLRISFENLKDPGINTLGLRRKIYACERCGFTRRKKEPVYPSGKSGLWMWLIGNRRNVKIAYSDAPPASSSSQDRRTRPE